jgi:hypothetical protein
MVTICAFCDTVIRHEPLTVNLVNHGICESCYKSILTNHGFNLKKFLDLLDAPVFLVDADVNILAANTRAIATAKKPVAQITGKLCGTVLECINAFLPEGCGKTTHCPDCTIRNSVNETYSTGNQITRRPAVVIRKNNGNQETVRLLVSTQKDGDIVLLRLEPIGVI